MEKERSERRKTRYIYRYEAGVPRAGEVDSGEIRRRQGKERLRGPGQARGAGGKHREPRKDTRCRGVRGADKRGRTERQIK